MKKEPTSNSFITNNRGATLMEIVIASGLLGLLAVGNMTLTKNQNRNQKRIEVDAFITSFMSEVRTIMGNSNACTNTLAPLLPGGQVSTFRDQNNNVRYQGAAGGPDTCPDANCFGSNVLGAPRGWVRLVQIRLDNYQQTGINTEPAINQLYGTLDLNFRFEKAQNNEGAGFPANFQVIDGATHNYAKITVGVTINDVDASNDVSVGDVIVNCSKASIANCVAIGNTNAGDGGVSNQPAPGQDLPIFYTEQPAQCPPPRVISGVTPACTGRGAVADCDIGTPSLKSFDGVQIQCCDSI